jgi:hypothetical protein
MNVFASPEFTLKWIKIKIHDPYLKYKVAFAKKRPFDPSFCDSLKIIRIYIFLTDPSFFPVSRMNTYNYCFSVLTKFRFVDFFMSSNKQTVWIQFSSRIRKLLNGLINADNGHLMRRSILSSNDKK